MRITKIKFTMTLISQNYMINQIVYIRNIYPRPCSFTNTILDMTNRLSFINFMGSKKMSITISINTDTSKIIL